MLLILVTKNNDILTQLDATGTYSVIYSHKRIGVHKTTAASACNTNRNDANNSMSSSPQRREKKALVTK